VSDQVHALPTDFFNIHFNVIFPPIPRPSKWCHSHRFPHQNPVCTSPFPHTCYMPAQLILLDCLYLERSIYHKLFTVSTLQISCPFLRCLRHSKPSVPDRGFVRGWNKLSLYDEELLAYRPTTQAGEAPLVSCPQLLIQYIRSYVPCLKAISSIPTMTPCHVVVILTHSSKVILQ
jgi:hypothetical protein